MSNCKDCGKAFEPTRADAQYCSDACRQRARRNRARVTAVTDNPVTDNRSAPGGSVTDNGPVTDNEQPVAPVAAVTDNPGETEAAAGAAQPPAATVPPWVISDVDAARRAERYRTARGEKGELIATRALRWELQDSGVPYQRLQQEVDRIQRLVN